MLTALMLAGRVGSGIAAELGSMVVTDQINALRALGTDPIRKLVVPRVLAGVIMAPILTVIADIVGILGGWIIAVLQLRVASSVYWTSVTDGLYLAGRVDGAHQAVLPRLRDRHHRVSRRAAHERRHAGGRAPTTNAVVAASVAVHRRGLLRHAAADHAAVLMATTHHTTRRRVERGRSSTAGAPVVVFDHVSLAFDEKVILRDVSFTLLPGHTKIILGASGAGKSTILKLILGLLKPDAGEIWVNGERVDDDDRERADAGARRPRHGVPGRRAVRFADGRARTSATSSTRRLTCRSTRCASASRKCSGSSASASTSTGCRRSCRAASAAASPSPARWRRSRGILLYDEPTTGLDPITATTIDEEIVKLRDLEERQLDRRDASAARRVLRRDARGRARRRRHRSRAGRRGEVPTRPSSSC